MPERNSAIALIAGLGNPGPEYQQTRHNAGFWYVDALARRWGVEPRKETKFRGWTARADVSGTQVWLLQPDTFMNLSGQSVAALASFYKVPVAQILVVHDELDLPVGSARLKQGGGHGGHNGLRSLIQCLGSADFWRLRIGIGHPGHKNDVVDYVLARPSQDDRIALERAIDAAVEQTSLLIRGEFERAMNVLHSASA